MESTVSFLQQITFGLFSSPAREALSLSITQTNLTLGLGENQLIIAKQFRRIG